MNDSLQLAAERSDQAYIRRTGAGAVGAATDALDLRCPVHDMPDCSPLLNGCVIVLRLHDYDRALVEAAIEGVADTYTDEGVAIWWRYWADHPPWQQTRLEQALGYGGMVAT